MTSTWESDLTQDAFLGGRLKIWQPKHGYRAGVDPVLLAASVSAQASDSVLELGCGVGVAALALTARTGASVTGLELQETYAQLAQRNAAENGGQFEAVQGDLTQMPAPIKARAFDHVIANPPYYDRARGTQAKNAGREAALGEGASLAQWLDAGIRRLRPKGTLTFIQRADRLADLLAGLDGRVGNIRVLPIAPREGKFAELLIIRAQKGGRGALKLLPPLVLHKGARHTKDEDSYKPQISAVLRDGQGLEIDW